MRSTALHWLGNEWPAEVLEQALADPARAPTPAPLGRSALRVSRVAPARDARPLAPLRRRVALGPISSSVGQQRRARALDARAGRGS